MDPGTDGRIGHWVARLQDGDRKTLARSLTLIENGPADEARALLQRLGSDHARAWSIGITGPPGAGKSTLTSEMVTRLRARGSRVAVLAVDPSSPVSGGALLGDRIRMQSHHGDDGVFIRSMATRGHLGGLAVATDDATRLLGAAGFEFVVLETVGVGQSEVEVAAAADVTVLVLNPGSGDAVQAAKAGVMEVGDVFVVNKADHPGADRVVTDVRGALQLAAHAPDDWQPVVLRTVGSDGTGVDTLLQTLLDHRDHQVRTGQAARRRRGQAARRVRQAAVELFGETVDQWFRADPQYGASLIAGVAAHSVTVQEAAVQVLRAVRGVAGPGRQDTPIHQD